MQRTTRTLLLAALAVTLPLAAFAGTTPAQTQTSVTATSTPTAKTHRSVTTPATPHHMKANTSNATKPASTHAGKSKGAGWVNLNEGTREQLMQLTGVTDTIADAIIAGRPYTSKSQLLDKKIVDEKTYKKITRHLFLKAPATKPAGR